MALSMTCCFASRGLLLLPQLHHFGRAHTQAGLLLGADASRRSCGQWRGLLQQDHQQQGALLLPLLLQLMV